MSLYGNFTLKEWLSLHCDTRDVNDLFRKALKKNDEPMSTLAMSELIKRGETDLVMYSIEEATNEGYITSGSHFSTFFTKALKKLGSRDPILRRIAENVERKGFWPETAIELLEGTDSEGELTGWRTSPQVVEDDLSVFQWRSTAGLDDRIKVFLKSFMRGGWFSVEFYLFTKSIENDSNLKEHLIDEAEECLAIFMINGFIMNLGDIPNILRILDSAGIKKALPAFDGREKEVYTLDDSGNWKELSNIEGTKEKFLCVTYRSLI